MTFDRAWSKADVEAWEAAIERQKLSLETQMSRAQTFDEWYEGNDAKYLDPVDIIPWCREAFNAGLSASQEPVPPDLPRREREELFLKELTELTRRTGVEIGCECCCCGYLVLLTRERDSSGSYQRDEEEDSVGWVND